MPSTTLLDACGRRRSPATMPSFHQGLSPRNKGQRYPADPPTVEEIIAVMHAAGDDNDAVRLRGLIVVLWRAGLRISEALALTESDLDLQRGAILVCRGKGGKRREVGMDRWAWQQLTPWLQVRARLPVGALFCVRRGPDRRPRVGACGCPLTAAPHRCLCGCAAALCAASAAPRARRRDVSRGRALARHPTPTRTCRSRDHLGLPARDRQHRDRPRRPRTPRSDDPGHPRPVDLRPLSLVGRPRTIHEARRIGPCRTSPTPARHRNVAVALVSSGDVATIAPEECNRRTAGLGPQNRLCD